MSEAQRRLPVRRANAVIAIVLCLAVLHLGRDLLIPVALAIFFALLLSPLVHHAQRRGLARVPAVLVVLTTSLVVLVVGGWLVGSEAVVLVQRLPEHRQNVVLKARSLHESFSRRIQPASQVVQEITREISGPSTQPAHGPAAPQDSGPPDESEPAPIPEDRQASASRETSELVLDRAIDVVRAALPPVLSAGAAVGLAIVFAIFFLIFREDLRDRMIRLCGAAHIGVTTAALSDVGTRVSRYFAGFGMVNALCGVAISLGLAFLGVPNALLFGSLTAILRFVPFVGVWIAAVLATVLTLAVFDGWMMGIAVLVLFLAVDLVCANLLEPWFYGVRIGASPTAVLLAMAFWTWLWGVAGLLLATPITVCLVVLGKNVAEFQILYVLFGDQPALSPHTRFCQRLLTMDSRGAIEIVTREAESETPARVFSSVVIPALSYVAVEDRGGGPDGARTSTTRQVVGQLLERLLPSAAAAEGPYASASGRPVATTAAGPVLVITSVQGPYDELAARILARCCEARGLEARLASPHLLLAEWLDWLQGGPAPSVCLVCIDAAGMRRLELLCRRISDAQPTSRLLLGIWDPAADQAKLAKRLARFPGLRLYPTLEQTLGGLGSGAGSAGTGVPSLAAAEGAGAKPSTVPDVARDMVPGLGLCFRS